jgi:hypothetical protein
MPQGIRKYIYYNGDNGQIRGFDELFVYLERSSAAAELRERIVAYFKSHLDLRGHLSRYFIFFSVTHSQITSRIREPLGHEDDLV